jgi:hypothetical protein
MCSRVRERIANVRPIDRAKPGQRGLAITICVSRVPGEWLLSSRPEITGSKHQWPVLADCCLPANARRVPAIGWIPAGDERPLRSGRPGRVPGKAPDQSAAIWLARAVGGEDRRVAEKPVTADRRHEGESVRRDGAREGLGAAVRLCRHAGAAPAAIGRRSPASLSSRVAVACADDWPDAAG